MPTKSNNNDIDDWLGDADDALEIKIDNNQFNQKGLYPHQSEIVDPE